MFERSYGVEIEAIAPYSVTREGLADSISRAGISCEAETLNHTTQRYWKVVKDGSLRGEGHGNGLEIVSPPLKGEAGFREIERVCTVLKNRGLKVNKSCGLHVHVDVRHPEMSLDAIKRLALLYVENETLIDKLMPASRRASQNDYCRSIAHASLARIDNAASVAMLQDALGPKKYVKLNLRTYWRQGTVEFRHHSGTVEAGKIIKWVQACLRMVRTACDERLAGSITVDQVERTVRAVRAGTKTAIIHAMLTRPQGCTTSEVLAATGWRQASVQGVGHTLGLHIRQVRERDENGHRVIRYFGDRESPAAAPRTPRVKKLSTIDELAEHLGMTEDERLFWIKRAELLAA